MQPFEWIDVKCDLPNYDEMDYLRILDDTDNRRERELSDIVLAADDQNKFYVGYFSTYTSQSHDDFEKGTAWWTFHPFTYFETYEGVDTSVRPFPDPRLIHEALTLAGLHIKCWAYIPSIPDKLSWESHFRV